MIQPTDRSPDLPVLSTISQKANVPGIRRLWLVDVRQVVALTDPRTLPDGLCAGLVLPEGGLELQDDAVLYEFRFPADAGGFTQKSVVTVQGVSYHQTLTLSVPKDHPQTALAFERMAGRRWIAIYTDGNDLQKLVGTIRQPLRVTSELAVGVNRYTLSWSTETRHPAWFLAETDSLLLTAYFSTAYEF